MDTVPPNRNIHLLPWIALGVAGVLLYAGIERFAKPGGESAIDVGRFEAAAIAETFLAERGFDVDAFRHATVFQQDNQARSFIEKEFSREEAQHILGENLPLFHWYARWFQPGELTDYRVWLSPEGALNGFARGLPDDAPGDRLGEFAADALARSFLSERAISLDGWSIHQRSAEEHPNRTDHNITWQRDVFPAAPAYHRMWVQIQGGEVGAFYNYIETPEVWDRAQSKDNAWRNLLQQLSAMPYNALMIAVIGLLLVYMRKGQARYGFALAIACLVACVDVAASLNNLPNRWIAYATNQPVAGFWASAVWQIALSGVMTVFNIAILGIVAEVLGRKLWGINARLADLYKPAAWASRDVAAAVVVGYGLMGLHLAYNAAFYVIGRDAFGVWSPEPSIYSNLLSTPFPFLYPLTIGLSAAVNEELTFRLIAVALLYRATRSWSVAILVPAVVWAFQHSLYPQDPVYIRGVELTAVGIAYGVVFLRYGLVAVLVAHFGYNAVVSSEILLTSGSAYLNLSGLIVVLALTLPLWPAAWRIARRKPLAFLDGRSAEPDIVDGLTHPVEPPPVALPTPPSRKAALRLGAMILAALAIAAGSFAGAAYLESRFPDAVAGSALSRVFAEDLRPVIETTLNRREVTAIADAYLAGKGVDFASWQRTVSFDRSHGDASMDYLYQRTGWETYWAIVEEKFRHNAHWQVRYFQPGEPEAYYVYVLPDGTPHIYWRALAEDAPGAKLSQEEARRIAEAAIANETPFNLGEYALADSDSTVRDNRTDHWFAYEWKGLDPEKASVRLAIRVLGDEALYPVHYVDVPNTWTRERAARGIFDYAAAIVGGALAIAAGIALGALFVRCYLADLLPWRAALPWAAVVSAAAMLRIVDIIPLWWNNYSTTIDPAVFTTAAITQYANSIAMTFLGAWVGVAFAAAVVRLYLGSGATIRTTLAAYPRPQWAEGYLRALAAFSVLFAVGALGFAGSMALAVWHGTEPQVSIFTQAPVPKIEGVELGLIPAIVDAADGLTAALSGLAFFAFFWAVAARYFNSPKRLVAVYLLLSLEGALVAMSRPLLSLAEHIFLMAVGAAVLLFLYLVARNLFHAHLAAAACFICMPAFLGGIGAADLPDAVAMGAIVALLLVGCAAILYIFRTPQTAVLDAPPDHLSS